MLIYQMQEDLNICWRHIALYNYGNIVVREKWRVFFSLGSKAALDSDLLSIYFTTVIKYNNNNF